MAHKKVVIPGADPDDPAAAQVQTADRPEQADFVAAQVRKALRGNGDDRSPPRGIAGAKEGAGPNIRDIHEFLLQAVPFRWVELTIVGLTPLITHRASPRVVNEIEEKQGGKARQKKPPRVPPRDCLEAAHLCVGRYDLSWLDKNTCGFPAVGIKKAMAAGGYRFGDAPNIVESLGAITVHGPYDGLIPILDLDGQPAPYVQRRDPVTLKAAGSMSLAYRPGFFPWRMVFQVQYCPSFLGLEKILNYLYLAGLTIGIGSWRKEKGGEMGKFKMESFLHLPDDFVPFFEKGVVDEYVPVPVSSAAKEKPKADKAAKPAKAAKPPAA